jgi:hypothetical protein
VGKAAIINHETAMIPFRLPGVETTNHEAKPSVEWISTTRGARKI